MDDYFAWAGCKQATDQYRAQHGIGAPLTRIDETAVCWVKSQAGPADTPHQTPPEARSLEGPGEPNTRASIRPAGFGIRLTNSV